MGEKKPARRTVDVRVLREQDGAKQALTVGLTGIPSWGTAEQVTTFTFYRSPTVLERTRILGRMHELAGGLAAYVELQAALESTGEKVRRRLNAELWPDGRPETDDPAERKAQEVAFNAAWMVDATPTRAHWLHLRDIVDRWEFMAQWEVLAASVPPGWASVADVEADETMSTLLRTAFKEAFAEVDAGK
jgi:hypothetical protein